MGIRILVGLVASTAAALAFAAPARAEWLEARSKHFVVYGDLAEAELRDKTQKLERYDAALRAQFGLTTEDVATIYMVDSLDDIRRLSGRAGVGAYYRSSAQESHGFVPRRLPREIPGMTADTVLYHEYTHHILLSNTSQYFPGWATEGLAELFSTARFADNGDVIIGAPNESRGYAMNGLSAWSVKRLIESDINPPKQTERIELYSRGWLLCHYLLISGNRPGQFAKYVELINKGVTPLQAGQTAFGDLGKLDSEVERYVRGRSLQTSLLSANKIKADTNVAVRKMTAGEAAIMPYRMVSANGVTEKTAESLAEKASAIGARYPGDIFVQRAMAEMEYDSKHYEAAEAAANRVLAVDPKNVMALAYKGRVHAQRALKGKDANEWREARRLFLAANQANPDHALPFELFYDSYVAAGQVPPASALTGIRRAIVLVPADIELRIRAGMALIRVNELALARSQFAPVAYDPHNNGKNPFAKLVAVMDAGADRETLLAKAAELKIDRVNEFDPPKFNEDVPDKGS